MTPIETLSYLRALTDPTSEQLREASDLALLAIGWIKYSTYLSGGRMSWKRPDSDPQTPVIFDGNQPHPCASIDDAVRWMVPKGYLWDVLIDPDYAEVRYVKLGAHPDKQGKERAKTEALARTIAGLAATLEGEK